jgi:DNA-binding MarR family transcriptional regulator
MLEILRLEGPATATTLAKRLGVHTGSTSWHLQKLAEHGYIDEVVDKGTHRERWWRALGVQVQYAEAMEAGEEQAAATTEFLSLTLRMESDRAQAFLRQDWEFDWRDAAFFNAFDDLFLDPETVVKMQAEICQVASRYAEKPCTTPEARRVLFTMQGFPYRPNDSPDSVHYGESPLTAE